jgi:HD-GYP domain-containing protein (c-di-GMP phosphodiesterase class II)
VVREAQAGRWAARPRLALLVRVLVVAVPVVVAVLVAVLVALLLPHAEGPARLLWWLLVLAASTAALLTTDRLARKALPLAVLLELALVFPGPAPSRVRASRSGSVKELEGRLDALRKQGADGPALEAAETLVVLVGVLGLHDKRTRGHSERVRALTDLLTAEMGLDDEDRAKVRWAALVHDLGKLRVPTAVLNGGRELDDEQWEVLRRHPEEGQRLAAGFVTWLGPWGRTIVEHHERWDGAGYPAGIAGEEISLGARIVAVADSFEVMTAHRSYAPARSAVQAREELARCAGSQFDPAVVRAFLGISVRRLSWVLGPVTWAAQVPLVATLDRGGQFAKVAAVSLIAGSLLVLGGCPATRCCRAPRPRRAAVPVATRCAKPVPSRPSAEVPARPSAAAVPVLRSRAGRSGWPARCRRVPRSPSAPPTSGATTHWPGALQAQPGEPSGAGVAGTTADQPVSGAAPARAPAARPASGGPCSRRAAAAAPARAGTCRPRRRPAPHRGAGHPGPARGPRHPCRTRDARPPAAGPLTPDCPVWHHAGRRGGGPAWRTRRTTRERAASSGAPASPACRRCGTSAPRSAHRRSGHRPRPAGPSRARRRPVRPGGCGPAWRSWPSCCCWAWP